MTTSGPLMVPVGTPRRVFVVALILGGVVLAAASLLGYALIGGLFVVGLALGVVNNVMTVRSILRHTEHGDPDRKRYTKSALIRLGYISLIAGVFVVAFRGAGIAVLVGLAVFHLLASLASALPLLKEFRKV